MIKVFLLEICPYVYYVLPLIRGRHHLVRDTAAEKEADIAIEMTLKYVNSEMDENCNFYQRFTNATKQATSSKRIS